MTRRSGLAAGLRLAMGLAALPLVGLVAGCGGSGMSKYNDEGFSRDDFKKPEGAGKGAPPVSDPDDPREKRRKKLQSG